MKLWLRLLIAIPLAAIFVWIGYTICMPLAFVAGMLSDSCDRLYVLGEIWILVLWTGVLLIPTMLRRSQLACSPTCTPTALAAPASPAPPAAR